MKRSVNVTDRAVLRYLERVMGFDIEKVREHIRGVTLDAIEAGATSKIVDGFAYELDPRSRSVCTVLAPGMKNQTTKGRDRLRVV